MGFIENRETASPETLQEEVATTIPHKDHPIVVSSQPFVTLTSTAKSTSTLLQIVQTSSAEVHAASSSSVITASASLNLKLPQDSEYDAVEVSSLPARPSKSSASITEEDVVEHDVDLNHAEMKVIHLFKDGFQQSAKTNITSEMKVLGALNHSCYKQHLGIVATHLKLSNINVPSVAEFGKAVVREKYLKEVVQAYGERLKGKEK